MIRICARIGATESRRRGSTESVALPKVRCWLLGSGAWFRSGLLRKPVSYPGGWPTPRRYHTLRLQGWRQPCECGFPCSRKAWDSRAFAASRVAIPKWFRFLVRGALGLAFPSVLGLSRPTRKTRRAARACTERRLSPLVFFGIQSTTEREHARHVEVAESACACSQYPCQQVQKAVQLCWLGRLAGHL